MKLRSEQGFTLVETLFSVAIFPMIFFAIYSVMSSAQVIMNTNDVYSRLNTSAMQTLRYISREVGQTSPNALPNHLNISSNGGFSAVRFQIPVDWDNDGDVVTSSLNPAVEWGAYDIAGGNTDGRLSGWVRYSVSNNQLRREVLDGTLTPIDSLTTVVANNVQAFTVSQSTSALTMSVTLRAADNVGQSGQARNFQTTFSSTTILRNAVN